MENILEEIREERFVQNSIWGEQNHSVIEWQAILMEEIGEVSREAVDFHFVNPIKMGGSERVAVEPEGVVQSNRLDNYRKELIQAAAVIVQMIECLDRNRTF